MLPPAAVPVADRGGSTHIRHIIFGAGNGERGPRGYGSADLTSRDQPSNEDRKTYDHRPMIGPWPEVPTTTPTSKTGDTRRIRPTPSNRTTREGGRPRGGHGPLRPRRAPPASRAARTDSTGNPAWPSRQAALSKPGCSPGSRTSLCSAASCFFFKSIWRYRWVVLTDA